jgi:hypothetical protein
LIGQQKLIIRYLGQKQLTEKKVFGFLAFWAQKFTYLKSLGDKIETAGIGKSCGGQNNPRGQ